MNAATIGKRISILRNAQGMSQIQLSVKLGISQAMLSSLESGKRLPSTSTVIKLATFFNASFDAIVNEYFDETDEQEKFVIELINIKLKKLDITKLRATAAVINLLPEKK